MSWNEKDKEMTIEQAFAELILFVILAFFFSLRFFAYPFLLIGAAVEKNREKQGKKTENDESLVLGKMRSCYQMGQIPRH